MPAGPGKNSPGLIAIAPTSSGTAADSCTRPTEAKFFRLTMFTHIHATSYLIRDGATLLYNGTDPSTSTATTALTSPFITFATNRLTYSCSCVNPLQSPLMDGSSFTTDETCMALGWYFPSTHAGVCLDGTVITAPPALSAARETPRIDNRS